MTREDVIPLWIANQLHEMAGQQDSVEWRSNYAAGGIVERKRDFATSLPTVVVKAVCTSCNSGWMANLEGKVKPLLECMIRGETVSLSMNDQLDLATWSAKTVAAIEFHEPTTVVLAQDERELIRAERRPPHNQRIRIAHRSTYEPEPFMFRMSVGSADGPDTKRPNVFACLLAFGHVIIHVWGGRGAEMDPLFSKSGSKFGAAQMIWPPVPSTTTWPPDVSIADDTIDAFATEVLPQADDAPSLAEWRQSRQ